MFDYGNERMEVTHLILKRITGLKQSEVEIEIDAEGKE